MKGLILKDFINLKKSLKLFGGMTVLYGVMSAVSGDSDFFSVILVVLVAVLTFSLYSYDDLVKWDSYALTMPVSKENIIQGKYLMMALLTLIGSVYSIAFTLILNIILKKASLLHGFANIGTGACVVILFYCIIIPFITKLGVEKARIIFFALYIIPFVIMLALDRLRKDGGLVIPDSFIKIMEILVKNIYIIAPVVVLLSALVSYRVSISIYKKKEF